jgi:hypothetical protein
MIYKWKYNQCLFLIALNRVLEITKSFVSTKKHFDVKTTYNLCNISISNSIKKIGI